MPDNYQTLSIKELSSFLDKKYKLWEQGKLEILTPEDMKKRLVLKNKKEAQRPWWGKLLDQSVSMPTLKYSIFKHPKTKKSEKVVIKETKVKEGKKTPAKANKAVIKETKVKEEKKIPAKANKAVIKEIEVKKEKKTAPKVIDIKSSYQEGYFVVE